MNRTEELLVKHCSPTLAGMKTGSMFSCAFENDDEMRKTLRNFNRILGKKGLCVLPLKKGERKTLIYVFRPSHLSRDLADSLACRILTEKGYPCHCAKSCIKRLICNLKKSDDFPHEVGLFLGYPPEDVCGFIENRADCFKCVGSWKVYGDEAAAKKLFAKFNKCTCVYCKKWQQGSSIDRLTVAG